MLRIILLASALLNVGPVSSDADPAQAPDWLIRIVAAQGRTGGIDAVRQRLGMVFDTVSAGGDTIDQRAFEQRDQLNRAQMRAQFLSTILSKDLNGDGEITKDELDTYYAFGARSPLRSNNGVTVEPTKEQSAQIIEKAEERDWAYDSDGDRKITFAEMLAAATRRTSERSAAGFGGLISPANYLSLDGNHDGVLTRDEFLTAVTQAYRQIDTDGNGKLDPEEIGKSR